jgi:hypothetical protein
VAATILSEDTFDRSGYAAELDAAPGNLDVGTRLWLENDRIRAARRVYGYPPLVTFILNPCPR